MGEIVPPCWKIYISSSSTETHLEAFLVLLQGQSKIHPQTGGLVHGKIWTKPWICAICYLLFICRSPVGQNPSKSIPIPNIPLMCLRISPCRRRNSGVFRNFAASVWQMAEKELLLSSSDEAFHFLLHCLPRKLQIHLVGLHKSPRISVPQAQQ